MRSLIFLALMAATPNLVFADTTLMVCHDRNGDYADVTFDTETNEILVRDLATSQPWLNRKLDGLDSVYSFHTKGLEIRETAHSDKLLKLEDLNVARSIKLLFMVPQDVFTAGLSKMGIHKADEIVMTKNDHGNWKLEFGRSKQGLTGGYWETVGKDCELKIAAFFEAWPEKAAKHHKPAKGHHAVEADGAY